MLLSESAEPPECWIKAGFVKRTVLDLERGCQAGLWSRNTYRPEHPYLILLEAPQVSAGLAAAGTILQMEPNLLRLGLNEHGEATIRLLHVEGWRAPAAVTVERLSADLPWIRVTGKPDSVVELTFKYFGT